MGKQSLVAVSVAASSASHDDRMFLVWFAFVSNGCLMSRAQLCIRVCVWLLFVGGPNLKVCVLCVLCCCWSAAFAPHSVRPAFG